MYRGRGSSSKTGDWAKVSALIELLASGSSIVRTEPWRSPGF
jgi:hypothetical protein